MDRPHLVILGAGASVAAFPNGDANGRKLPTMANFIKTLNIKELKERENENIENVYSELAEHKGNEEILTSLEFHIRQYFSSLDLPPYPTLYDHLILSLSEKDAIATFNWDPFLFKACKRIREKITNQVPQLIFLHGNVAIKVDHTHKKIVDALNHSPNLKDSPLLYPINKKNYTQDPFINSSWKSVKNFLEEAYIITIFGYSAPSSDYAAMKLLNEAFNNNETKEQLEFEIIDIKEKEELRQTWEPFIHDHHFRTSNDFYESLIAKFPRRTCESIYEETMECKFINYDMRFPKELDWENLLDWYHQLNKNKA